MKISVFEGKRKENEAVKCEEKERCPVEFIEALARVLDQSMMQMCIRDSHHGHVYRKTGAADNSVSMVLYKRRENSLSRRQYFHWIMTGGKNVQQI